MRHVIFRLGNERYALPLAAVREVLLPPPSLSRVPRAPPPIRGVMNLRGRVVTVVELRSLLRLAHLGAPSQKIVLLDRGRKDLGLLVSEVDGIEPIEKVPQPEKEGAAVSGMVRVRGQAVTLLHPSGIDAAVIALFPK